MAGHNGPVVNINDIHDIDPKKITPADFNKVFVDRNGQEWKIRFNTERNTIQYVRILHDRLDGRFIKQRYDDYDTGIKSAIKTSLADYGHRNLDVKYGSEEEAKAHDADAKASSQRSDTEEIRTIEALMERLELVTTRVNMAEKNIYESRVFDPRLNFKSVHAFDEVSRYISREVLDVIKELKTFYSEVLEGREDERLKKKHLIEETAKKLHSITDVNDKIKFLRNIEIRNRFEKYLTNTNSALNELIYWVENVDRSAMSANSAHERNNYKDALITLKTCRTDVQAGLDFLRAWSRELLK